MGPSGKQDDYEAKYMSAGSEVLAREKLRMPKWLQALTAIPFLVGLAFGALLIWFMFAYSDGFA